MKYYYYFFIVTFLFILYVETSVGNIIFRIDSKGIEGIRIGNIIHYLLNIVLNGKEIVYNVGGDNEPVSIYELASIIADKFNVEVIKGCTKNTTNKSAPKNVGLSMTKYRTEFNKNQNIGLNLGIQKTIEWFNFKKGIK